MEKPTFGEKFRALLATGRVANLPTVWSNVLVGYAISTSFVFHLPKEVEDTPFVFSIFTFLLIATSLIYVGGCMLGDARDIEYDRIHKPDRPIPSGVISSTFVSLTAWAFLLGGLILIALSSLISAIFAYNLSWLEIKILLSSGEWLVAIQLHEIILCSLLILTIVVYAFIHKKYRIVALTLMAVCRTLLVFLAISVAHKTFFSGYYGRSDYLFIYRNWGATWMPVLACIVGLYTLLLSWVASTEASPSAFSFRKTLGVCMLALPFVSIWLNSIISAERSQEWWHGHLRDGFLTVSTNLSTAHSLLLILALSWIGYALWALKTSKPTFVSRALAGFCLLDAVMVAGHSPLISLICIGLFGLALLLQRVTPAT